MRNPFKTTLVAPALLALALAAGLSGAAMAQPGPPPYPNIPPLRHEVVPPPPPGARMVWESGHWRWNGNGYVWIAGRYAPVGRVHGRWVHGHWAWRGGAWAWEGSHWE